MCVGIRLLVRFMAKYTMNGHIDLFVMFRMSCLWEGVKQHVNYNNGYFLHDTFLYYLGI